MGKGGDARPSGGRQISAAEISKHDQPGDCWLLIRGKVYDVSKWREHPGGRVMYTYAGADATETFTAFHSGAAYEVMQQFYIGDCSEPMDKGVNNAFEEDIRALYPKLVKNGVFRANKWYYLWKFLSTSAILAASMLTAAYYHDSWSGIVISALLVGLFWQQTGWMAHDFAHHQVFKTRLWNDMTCMVIGCIYLGFSMAWWKNKHNTHHAIPNLHETGVDAHDGDPDIDTLPFLAWSTKLVSKMKRGPAIARFLIRYQQFVYFPLLLFARFTWAMQSFMYAYQLEVPYFGATDSLAGVRRGNDRDTLTKAELANIRYPVLERACLLLHYAWYLGMIAAWMTPAQALAFMVIGQGFSGLLIALAFGVGHNGMAVYDADTKPGFAELQIMTTRNVDDVGLVGWFMGGLHYQIEHHIFPTVPRHNLHRIKPLVVELCRKHSIPYHSTGLYAGTLEVLRHLKTIAQSLKDFPAM